jgi:hypothetical protein
MRLIAGSPIEASMACQNDRGKAAQVSGFLMIDRLSNRMARFDEVSDRLAFWQQKPRYDGAEYDLSHLKPLDRPLATHKGESIPLRFRFSYHCCTDKPGKRDLGARIREETRPEEDRYFCPVRWFLSLRLPALALSLDTARLAPVPGYQWLHTERIPGISLPWAVWMKVMPGPSGGATVIGVESAYLAGSPPKGGQPETFRFVVEQTRRLGKLYGMPPRAPK